MLYSSDLFKIRRFVNEVKRLRKSKQDSRNNRSYLIKLDKNKEDDNVNLEEKKEEARKD